MFGKVFAQIFDSSLVEEPLEVRYVFVAAIILSDRNGVLDTTPESLARRINVPLEAVVAALERLQQPDPRSRSREHDGRRLVRLDGREWGWRVVNKASYRDALDLDDLREGARERKRRQRERERSEPVTSRHKRHAKSRHTEAETDSKTEKDAEEKKKPRRFAEYEEAVRG